MAKPSSPNRSNTETAQSLVEMAISLMIMLMLLLGAVEISLALFQYVTIRDAAQEGALYGSVNPVDETGIDQRAIAAAGDVLVIDSTQITITHTGPTPACEGTVVSGAPNTIKVKIVYPHHITFPIVGPMIGTNTITLTASVTNTILQPPCP